MRRPNLYEQGPHTKAQLTVHCSDEQRKVVDGLAVDDDLGGFRVTNIRCERTKVIEIDLLRDTTQFLLMVAEPGAVPHDAPRQTSQHDLYYNRRGAHDGPPTDAEVSTLLELLAKRVQAGEQKAGSGK